MMLDTAAPKGNADGLCANSDFMDRMRAAAKSDLAPHVTEIDRDGFYPEAAMRRFGLAGAYARHLPGLSAGGPDLMSAIRAMALASEHCLSTAFCMWCQNALGWYVFTSENEALKETLGREIAAGAALGGTGLSNPMKSFFGIEPMRLKAQRGDGGYTVTGVLPWVSNLGPDHYFGTVFEVQDEPRRHVMAIIPCNAPGVQLGGEDAKYLALDGSRTFSVRLRDAFIADNLVLADPSGDYIKRIRAGFVLLQTGMGFGLIRASIDMMRQLDGSLGHVNKYLDVQPEGLAGELAALEGETAALAATPFETDAGYWRRVIEVRLAVSELSLKAANALMLHSGARGYVANAAAQRRLREAYFVAIVTPAIKQLKKMLADIAA